jgi:phosphotransacetylase
MMGDPRVMQEMADMLSKMTPEQLEAQMQEAMKMITSGDMMKTLMGQSDEILKVLAETGAVPPDEIAKFKADPEYFEQKMQESFSQMQGILNDPAIMKAATETMGGLTELLQNPGLIDDMLKGLMSDFGDDEAIEKARLTLLTDPESMGHPMMKEMFASEEMQEILKDPVKWRESVKEGQGMMQGAGVGEL